MQRRKFILGAGSLAAAGAAAMGTGAFTQVHAERKLKGKVVSDANAQVQILTDKGQNGEYAYINENTGELYLNFENLNPDSHNVLGGVFEIKNGTGEKVDVTIENNVSISGGDLRFVHGDKPGGFLDNGNTVTLQVGNSDNVLVGVVIDLDDVSKGVTFGSDDNFTIVATTDGSYDGPGSGGGS